MRNVFKMSLSTFNNEPLTLIKSQHLKFGNHFKFSRPFANLGIIFHTIENFNQ